MNIKDGITLIEGFRFVTYEDQKEFHDKFRKGGVSMKSNTKKMGKKPMMDKEDMRDMKQGKYSAKEEAADKSAAKKKKK